VAPSSPRATCRNLEHRGWPVHCFSFNQTKERGITDTACSGGRETIIRLSVVTLVLVVLSCSNACEYTADSGIGDVDAGPNVTCEKQLEVFLDDEVGAVADILGATDPPAPPMAHEKRVAPNEKFREIGIKTISRSGKKTGWGSPKRAPWSVRTTRSGSRSRA
jgi:hypothetical protein